MSGITAYVKNTDDDYIPQRIYFFIPSSDIVNENAESSSVKFRG